MTLILVKLFNGIFMKTICYVRRKSRKHIFRLGKKFSDFPLVIESKLSGSWLESDLGKVVLELNVNSEICISNCRDLGGDILESLELLSAIVATGAILQVVQEKFHISRLVHTSNWDELFLRLIEVERCRRSERTKKALAKKRASGVILGRPRGRTTSGLDQHETELRTQIARGVTQKFLAKKYGVNPATISAWMKRNDIRRP